jgi:hypothetical protein
MERRGASHTEEEEMNQRRRLLNAARRGDTKAIGKLFELYQVRVLSGDQLAKVNRTLTYMAPVKSTKAGPSGAKRLGKKAKEVTRKRAKVVAKKRAKASKKFPAKKRVQPAKAKSRKAKHR